MNEKINAGTLYDLNKQNDTLKYFIKINKIPFFSTLHTKNNKKGVHKALLF